MKTVTRTRLADGQYIGHTPWGTPWYAYFAEDVQPMTKRLEEIKARWQERR